MGRRVRHIRSVPPIAEVFYEVTGKEPQPRPMGEEHGLVVFSYLPDSPVNYFRLVAKHCFLSFRGNCLLFLFFRSRSVAAPTPDCPQEFKSELVRPANKSVSIVQMI